LDKKTQQIRDIFYKILLKDPDPVAKFNLDPFHADPTLLATRLSKYNIQTVAPTWELLDGKEAPKRTMLVVPGLADLNRP
jgi:hypothetical protein